MFGRLTFLMIFFLDSTEISSLPIFSLRQATEPLLSSMKKAEVGKNPSQKRAFLQRREFPIAMFSDERERRKEADIQRPV